MYMMVASKFGITTVRAEWDNIKSAMRDGDVYEARGFHVAIFLNGAQIYPTPTAAPRPTNPPRPIYQTYKALDTFDGSEGR